MNRHTALRNQKGQMPSALHNISPKTMAAIVLMSTMAILWGRVLLGGKNGPESASAAEDILIQQEAAASAAAGQGDVSVRLACVELPYQTGRSDTLACDLFSTERWTAFRFNEDNVSQAPVKAAADGLTEERKHQAVMDAMAKELVLEAVVQGTNGSGTQAFIGGKILSVGQTLTVKQQGQTYTLTISEISPQQAILTWRSYSIRLRITESQEL
jgi:hypothetical protein